jgi:hypothetical protein
VTAPAGDAPPAASVPPAYYEPARTYASAVLLFLLIALGFGLDMALGGAWSCGASCPPRHRRAPDSQREHAGDDDADHVDAEL